MKNNIITIAIALSSMIFLSKTIHACTGITLKATDGAVIFGRTMEWGTFDLRSRIVVIPRNYEMKSSIADDQIGITWKSTYGVVGLDALEKDFLVDGMNEKGLTVNVFYHPGFAEYTNINAKRISKTIESVDVAQYLLSTCKTTSEAKNAILDLDVVAKLEPAIGIKPPIHMIVTDRNGDAAVIEFLKGKTTIFNAPLGCITNAPAYDWHITNLRNYLNLSQVALPSKNIAEMNFAPLGGGSGMIGLPGDNTPPSRFVRAVAFTQTARPTNDGKETLYELFRILDNFNLPLGAAEGEGKASSDDMRSSTIWTTGYDTKNLLVQYHTMHNRRVRQVDLSKINFSGKEILRMPLDRKKQQDIDDVTAQLKSK